MKDESSTPAGLNERADHLGRAEPDLTQAVDPPTRAQHITVARGRPGRQAPLPGRRPVGDGVGLTWGWRESCTIRALSTAVDAVNGSGQQPRRTHESLRHHRRSQRRTNPSRRFGAGSIPAHARGSGERYRLVGRCRGCPAPSVGRWAGKRGGVLAAPWSVFGQGRPRNPGSHGAHCEHFRRSEPCGLPGIELLKRVSPVRIRPGAQSVCAGQGL